MKKGTWCAQFFDHWDDVLPSRVMIITANNEDEAVDKAASQMGNAARIEFARVHLGLSIEHPFGLAPST